MKYLASNIQHCNGTISGLTIVLLVLVNFCMFLVPTKRISDNKNQNDVDERQQLIIGSVTVFVFLLTSIVVSCLLIRRRCNQHTRSMDNQIEPYSVSGVSNEHINEHVNAHGDI